MSENDSPNFSDNLCVVCFKNSEIYSVGVCDHPVCYECSTRMRVLCKQNECPICRRDMPKVIFTRKKENDLEPFSGMFPKFEKSNLHDRRFGLIFCTSDIKKAYEILLEHRCQICKDWPYKNFTQLKDHMRKEHELFYCDICVDNLKIFTSERRCYNRQELGQHRRKGDPDNTSHRGHPLCEFCDTRFMDSDELFRHLRRNHLFCHFCDSDGKHQYYNHMDDLVRHFKEEHYLCDEGDCKNMPLTAVFRTDIDLKAHITMEHSRHMSKSATKQARTLELEFTLAPRMRSVDSLRNKRYNDRRDRIDDDTSIGSHNMEPGGPGGGGGYDSSSRVFVNPLTPQNFPALGGGSSNITVHARPATTVNFTSKLNSNLNMDDFPSLGGSKGAPTSEVTIKGTVRGQQGVARTKDNFPALGGSNSNSSGSSVRLSVNSSQDSSAPKLSIQVNRRPNGGITTHITTSASTSTQQRPTEAFPALGNTTTVVQPQWVQVKSKKQEPKASKVAPAPQLTPSSLEQFPSLSKKAPTGQTNWVNLNNINSRNASNSSKSVNNINANKNTPQISENSKKSENKVKNKQPIVESKTNEVRNGETSETKNKNKKKKNKLSQEVESTALTTPINKLETIDSKEQSKPLNKSEAINGSNNLTNNNNKDNNNKNLNGLVKKRSELNVGTLSSPDQSQENIYKDFPLLEGTKPPPGFNVKPPPGLQLSGLQPTNSQPPGFSPAAFPSLGNTDLTFTTSRGQSYSITPNSSYHLPSNFQSRNQNLIKRLMNVLNNNDVIKEFKTYSDLFRNGGYPTKNYYEHCKSVLGDSFDEIFPELMVLLPDIPKQQELYNSYNGKNKKNLLVCEHCKQIIFKKELSEHYNYHVLDNQFPTLGKVHQVESAWKK